jgi:iron complex outermembrane receptor protein
MLHPKAHPGLFKKKLFTCGGTLALVAAAFAAMPAVAQDAPAPAGEDSQTVVVTGIRRGIQDAITAKKRSTQIVEAVSAEDIGKLPDASIAESLARLPGLAAQRTNGRAQTLSIRGLGPDYTVTTMNGREQVSTNDNRSVEFDQYPSELISQVLIYKTPNASMTTQGIAGTADLQTVRPLAYGKRAAAINIRREMNSEEAAIGGLENSGSRWSFNYIDQFFDKTLGVAFGYAHTDSPYQVTRLEPWGDGDFPRCDGGTTCTNGGGLNKFILGGQKNGVQSSNLERDGLMGVLEWKPNDRLRVVVDAFHSEFEELQKIARLEYPLWWSSSQLQPGYTVDGDYIDHGVFTGVNTVVENYTNRRQATTDQIGVNINYALNDQWTLNADLSTQKLTRDDVIIESTAGTGAAGSVVSDTITFDMTDKDHAYNLSGVIDYSDFSKVFLTDPGGWGGPVTNRGGFFRAPHVEDELNMIKLVAERKIESGLFSKVAFGYSRIDRSKDKDDYAAYMSLTAPTVVVPEKYRTGVTDASFLGNTSGMISYDSLAMWQDGIFILTEATDNDQLRRSWFVEETVDAAFIRADIDTQLFGIPVTGNIGVMSQTAEQSAESIFVRAGTPVTKADGDKYTDVLPSLNLNFAVAEDVTVRFGAGTTLARPRMDDMATGTSTSVINDTSPPATFQGQPVYWTGSGGNAQIRPWKANAFDLSIEKYFGRKGYVSAAFFHKDLTSYIFNQTVAKDYTGVALPASCTTPVNICTKADANRMGSTSAQANGEGGWIRGAEFTVSVPGELITPWLDGFGAILTASYNDSEIDPNNTGNPVNIPGLSKEVINTTVYYEKYAFSARVSSRFRGEFTGEVPDYTNSLQTRQVQEENVVDAQIGYTFQSGPLKNLGISLSGSNLTNEPFYLYKGNNVVKEEKYGSTYLLGLSYRW